MSNQPPINTKLLSVNTGTRLEQLIGEPGSLLLFGIISIIVSISFLAIFLFYRSSSFSFEQFFAGLLLSSSLCFVILQSELMVEIISAIVLGVTTGIISATTLLMVEKVLVAPQSK